MYLYFLSNLNPDVARVVEILHVRQELVYHAYDVEEVFLWEICTQMIKSFSVENVKLHTNKL